VLSTNYCEQHNPGQDVEDPPNQPQSCCDSQTYQGSQWESGANRGRQTLSSETGYSDHLINGHYRYHGPVQSQPSKINITADFCSILP
jgi:hypothetical protein